MSTLVLTFMRKHIALKFGLGDACKKISLESVALKKIGRPVGANGILTSEQEALIRTL